MFLDPGIIVSIQPREESKFSNVVDILSFAKDCEHIPTAFRIEGWDNIQTLSRSVTTPIIGLIKKGNERRITPGYEYAQMCLDVGATYVAMECTGRVDTDQIQKATDAGIKVIADVEDYQMAVLAEKMGCVAITTALSGYIGFKAHPFEEPHFNTLIDCTASVGIPVIAEGRYRTAEHVIKAREYGAHSVCVGNVIHDPYFMVQYLKLHFKGEWEANRKNGFTEIV